MSLNTSDLSDLIWRQPPLNFAKIKYLPEWHEKSSKKTVELSSVPFKNKKVVADEPFQIHPVSFFVLQK